MAQIERMREKISQRPISYIDYAGFTYDGIHSSQLGLYLVSESKRYTRDLIPSITDQTSTNVGSDSTLYFGADVTKRDFTLAIAYDSIDEDSFHFMEKLFSKKKLVSLIFDETPYKQYWVKPTSTLQLKYICFDEGFKRERIYKGEGTLKLTCYDGFARSCIESQEDLVYNEWATGGYTIRLAKNSTVAADWIARVLNDEYGKEVPYNESPDWSGVHISLSDCKLNRDLYGRDNSYLPEEGTIYPYDTDVPIDTWIDKSGDNIVIKYANLRHNFPTAEDKEYLQEEANRLNRGNNVWDIYNYAHDSEEEDKSYDENGKDLSKTRWGFDPTAVDLSGLRLNDGETPTDQIAKINPYIQTFYNTKTNSFELMATYLGGLVEVNSKTGEVTSFDASGEAKLLVQNKNLNKSAYINIIIDGNMEQGQSELRLDYSGRYANYYEWRDAIELPETTPSVNNKKKTCDIYNIGHFDTPVNFYLDYSSIPNDQILEITAINDDDKTQYMNLDLSTIMSLMSEGDRIYINSELRIIQLEQDGKIVTYPVYNKYIKKGDFFVLHQFETLTITTNVVVDIELQYRFA